MISQSDQVAAVRRERELLNLPINSSLSVSLDQLGSHTKILIADDDQDRVFLNGKLKSQKDPFASKVIVFSIRSS